MDEKTHFKLAQEKAKRFNVELFKSTRKDKKYMFKNPITGHWIHFGSKFHSDYLIHQDPIRRENYRKRHEAIMTKDGIPAYKIPYSSSWAAYHILW